MGPQVKIKYFIKNIKKPFKGDELEINGRYVNYFYFIESIENMFITGSIEFDDTAGFFEALPLTGEETIKVIIEQNMEESQDSSKSINIIKEIEFDIYNVRIPKETSSIKGLVYRFTLVEKDSFNFMKKESSISFAKKKISDIVRSVCTNLIEIPQEKLNIEETNDTIDFIIPYWKPVVVLKYLVRGARRTKLPNEGGFLFYSSIGDEEQIEPVKNFVSFASLIEKKPKTKQHEKYYYRKMDINPFFVNNFKDVDNPNFCKRSILVDGVSGKRYFGLELAEDKKVIIVDRKYSQFVRESEMMGRVAYLSKDLDEVNGDVEFFGLNEPFLRAEQDYSFRMLIEGFNRRDVLMQGSLDRYAGKSIFVEQMSDNKSELYNKADTGKWLIKTITHHFTQHIFEQKLVIIKDSYTELDALGHQDV